MTNKYTEDLERLVEEKEQKIIQLETYIESLEKELKDISRHREYSGSALKWAGSLPQISDNEKKLWKISSRDRDTITNKRWTVGCCWL